MGSCRVSPSGQCGCRRKRRRGVGPGEEQGTKNKIHGPDRPGEFKKISLRSNKWEQAIKKRIELPGNNLVERLVSGNIVGGVKNNE